MKICRRGLALVVALLIMLLAVYAQAGSAKAERIQLPYFLNQFDNTPLNLKQYWGKAFLLFFFTEASPDCAKQLPEIKEIYESFSSDELQIVLIHEWSGEMEENTENVKALYGLESLTFFEDTDLAVAKKINIPGFPMTIFINNGGYMYDAFVYAVDYEKMAEVLDAMGVSRSLPTTPAPVEIPAVTEAPTSTSIPPASEPTETPVPTVVPFVTKAPTATPAASTPISISTGSAPLTPQPSESGDAPFGSMGAEGTK